MGVGESEGEREHKEALRMRGGENVEWEGKGVVSEFVMDERWKRRRRRIERKDREGEGEERRKTIWQRDRDAEEEDRQMFGNGVMDRKEKRGREPQRPRCDGGEGGGSEMRRRQETRQGGHKKKRRHPVNYTHIQWTNHQSSHPRRINYHCASLLLLSEHHPLSLMLQGTHTAAWGRAEAVHV